MKRRVREMTTGMATDETRYALRSTLGRAGIWMGAPAATGVAPQDAAQAIERSGFTSVWVGGGNR